MSQFAASTVPSPRGAWPRWEKRRHGRRPSKASELQLRSEEVTVMAVNWTTDVDKALATAKEQKKPLLLDFSAAPM